MAGVINDEVSAERPSAVWFLRQAPATIVGPVNVAHETHRNAAGRSVEGELVAALRIGPR